MEAITHIQQQSGTFDPMFGAAIVTEDGQEQPITVEQVNDFLEKFIREEESAEETLH